jgi:branched-chain amino acid transport system substrate-binding protein
MALLTALGPFQQVPYRDFTQAGAGFYGDGRELPEPVDIQSVRIGVLGPEKGRDGLQLRTAVEIAIEEANSRGGYTRRVKGTEQQPERIPYEMVFHEDDGPWGVAARQVVRFAYEDKVWAIIGGLDGQHTHLAELVVSKAWVPVISPGATDSSIDYANVPWVFRAVPADSKQVDALLDLAEKRGYRHLVVLTEMQREAYTGFLRLKEGSGRRHYTLDLHLEYSPQDPVEIVPRLRGIPMDAILVWGRSASALELISGLRRAGFPAPILGPSVLATTDLSSCGIDLGDVTVSASFDLNGSSGPAQAFRKKFSDKTGESPSAIAFYSYDVANLVLAGIEAVGLNRARIRDRISEGIFEGVTGKISFNSLGGNPARPVLMSLRGNHWVRLE